jgi:hypothetical protein
MSFEDPTRRFGGAADTTTALPGPLNLANGTGSSSSEPPGERPAEPPAETTDVLSLDEIFGGQPQPATPAAQPPPATAEPTAAQPPPPTAEPPSAADAPTWTAMPVVPVRSEPVTPARPQPEPPPQQRQRQRSAVAGRVRTDAAAAWSGGMRRSKDWFRRGDNTLIVLTAVVAIILIVAVSALGA